MRLKTIIIIACMLVLISSVVGSTSCPSNAEFEDAIRSAIVNYFRTHSEEDLNILKDLIEFYSTHDLSTADCSEVGKNSGVEIQEAYKDTGNVSEVVEEIDEKSTSLIEEVFSWVDDLLHSEVISNGLIRITLHSWSSDDFQFPIGSNNLYSGGGMRFAVRYNNNLKWSHDGWIGSSIQTLPVTEDLHFTENTNDRKVAVGKVADNNIEVKTEATLLKDKKWMLIKYTLKNKGSSAINNVKFYHGADFDVDHVSSGNDYGSYDSNLKLLYEWDYDGYPYVGFASTLNPPQHDVSNYRTIWNRINSDSLAGGNNYGIGDAGIAFRWDFGTLNPGETREIPVILAAGTNLNDLKNGIQEGLGYTPSLLQKYAPVLYLHPDELFRPKSIQSMLNEADLKLIEYLSDDVSVISLIDSVPVPIDGLNGRTTNHYLDMINAKPGRSYQIPNSSRFNNYPTTVYGRETEERNYIVLQYWFFYPYNNWLNKHEGDWEMIQILLDKATETPQKATYSYHYDGTTSPWSDIEKVDNTHPQVLVGKGSHASYKDIRGIPLKYRLNEKVSTNGQILNPVDYELIEINDATSWVFFEGRWGEIISRNDFGSNGPNSPANIRYPGTPNRWSEPVAWSENPTPSYIRALGGSPIDLHVYDSQGRHNGLNESGDLEIEIPNTYIFSPSTEDGEEFVDILTNEDLTFEIKATGEGKFDLSINTYNSDTATEVIATYENVPITAETVATVDVASDNPGFVMDVDTDGNDVVDYTRPPDTLEIYGLDLDCEVTNSVCDGVTVFKMYDLTNSHAQLSGSYPYSVCCSGVSGLGTDASGAVVLGFAGEDNSHVQKSSIGTYAFKAYLSAPSGITCDYVESSSDGYAACEGAGFDTCLASIQDSDNSHIGDCNTYNIKICCKA